MKRKALHFIFIFLFTNFILWCMTQLYDRIPLLFVVLAIYAPCIGIGAFLSLKKKLRFWWSTFSYALVISLIVCWFTIDDFKLFYNTITGDTISKISIHDAKNYPDATFFGFINAKPGSIYSGTTYLTGRKNARSTKREDAYFSYPLLDKEVNTNDKPVWVLSSEDYLWFTEKLDIPYVFFEKETVYGVKIDNPQDVYEEIAQENSNTKDITYFRLVSSKSSVQVKFIIHYLIVLIFITLPVVFIIKRN